MAHKPKTNKQTNKQQANNIHQKSEEMLHKYYTICLQTFNEVIGFIEKNRDKSSGGTGLDKRG